MREYVIYTDSACDISQELLQEWGVRVLQLSVQFKGENESFLDYEMPSKLFYQKMRDGQVAVTSAVNADTFQKAFAATLDEGLDVLYLAFSSGLSATYNSACIAVEELRAAYPERRIQAVDTLAASAGFGLLVYLAKEKKAAGASMEEVAQYIEDIRLSSVHWFTVDDLVYLKRGGRVSAATALLGGMLGIKPVLHVDNEGHLIKMSQVRGRRSSIKALADAYGKTKTGKGPIFISHGDCIDDAKALAEILEKDYGAKVDLITSIGPVIGAHSGPGTLALFYLGTER